MADEAGTPRRRRRDLPVRVVELDLPSVAAALGAFVGLITVTGLIRSAPRTITAVVIGSMLALALNPVVSAIQQRIGGHRPVAVATALMGVALVFVLIGALLGPPAARQADK